MQTWSLEGTIVRKLPRKVDVLEGENAAFCVEVEEEEMDIHWYKDGTELRETHQTILKSFGRTHILVFVNTTPQDSGLVMFYVGRSKTSSQLRVKGKKKKCLQLLIANASISINLLFFCGNFSGKALSTKLSYRGTNKHRKSKCSTSFLVSSTRLPKKSTFRIYN